MTGIALLGYGVVGQGVADLLSRLPQLPPIRAVVARDTTKPRDITPPVPLTDDMAAAVADPQVSVVVEVAGEVERTRGLLVDAMRAGKHVVTANKALLSAHFEELTGAAREAGVQMRYEAAVAGGIPIIRTLQHVRRFSAVTRVEGIINGSCNYLLSEMAATGRPMAELVSEAQAKGFLEADPSADVDGRDALRKLRILASLAFEVPVSEDMIECASIMDVTADDVAAARAEGCVIKQMSVAEVVDGRLAASVRPERVPATSTWGQLPGATNGVTVSVEALDDVTLIGQGAGRYPTAHAVVSDIVEICG